MSFVMATTLLLWRILKGLTISYGDNPNSYGEYRTPYGDNPASYGEIPSPYGENYFAMADMVCVVEEGMAEVIFDRTM